MKPILFNTEMVRAILDNRKTVTRRVVKKQNEILKDPKFGYTAFTPRGYISVRGWWKDEDGEKRYGENFIKLPYRSSDILYVRETWAFDTGDPEGEIGTGVFVYKADGEESPTGKWCPSIHMPKVAARIFLRVTDVRVERLQDITVESAKKEGAFHSCSMCTHWHDYCGQAVTLTRDCKIDQISPEFQQVWDSTIKPKDRAFYGWEVNPWVWVIEFEKINNEGIKPNA